MVTLTKTHLRDKRNNKPYFLKKKKYTETEPKVFEIKVQQLDESSFLFLVKNLAWTKDGSELEIK